MVQTKAVKLARIMIRGIVQGVGFRPFVCRTACDHGLKGWVRNTSGSVDIEVEGDETRLEAFINDLRSKAPPMAHIEDVNISFHPQKGYTGFEILESRTQRDKYQLVSPDIATCEDCRKEIFTPSDRRFRYPFTNCTNCGPRFTIIKDIPYDRPKTTMRVFKMCPDCQSEYDNPMDRRFHAQPNSCPICGPRLELVDEESKQVECNDFIVKAADLLKDGKILALRGLGGFQLACDATNEAAVNLLRERKRRPSKPFAVMLLGIAEAEKHCRVSKDEAALLKSPQSPIVLLQWQKEASDICPEVAPNIKYMGVMLPYTPLHHLLMAEARIPLVMTSGNLHEEPIAKDNDEALRRLKGIADYFLLHNREIYSRYDDSVCTVGEGGQQVVRRGRGYAPYPVFLPYKSKQILACGAEEKNTFCLTRDGHAFISQHIGDLVNEETLEHYENTIELYKKLFRVKPDFIACDMHPEYLSTKYALEMGVRHNLRTVQVQHHHAHIVSCMMENRVESPVIGIAFDGTGYGTDGTIWGGEFMVVDWHSFKRVGHLEQIPMPGGEAAIKKPYRMALSYIYTLLGTRTSLEGLPLGQYEREANEFKLIEHQLKRRLNSPLTSSAGRLFDAVAAFLGVRGEIDYEAQAAIELEMLASDEKDDYGTYPFRIVEQDGVKTIKLAVLIEAIIHEVRNQVPVPRISLKFHNTVAGMIADTCRSISEDTGIRRIALSGGVFQNRLLSRLALSALRKNGFEVLSHRLVPCNDGGIALGQAVIANFSNQV